jgi:hypothetical protein
MNATGRCLCGAVAFAAADVESELHVCHCSMCRRWAGGPTFCARVGKVEFTGAEHIGRYDSSAWAERGFCTGCGSNLFYRLKESDQYVFHLGGFDDQTPFATASEIYIDDKPSAYDLAGSHPRLTGEEFLASLRQS